MSSSDPTDETDQTGVPRKPGRPHRKAPRPGPWPEGTPFAHLLMSYAYEHRTRAHPRPLSAREIGDRCGYSRQTVNNWLSQGIEPPLMTMIDVLAKLGIPLQRLLDVYQIAYTELTAARESPRTPTRDEIAAVAEHYSAERQRDSEHTLRIAEQSLRSAGLRDEDVHRAIQHMRDVASGQDPTSRLHEEEFTGDVSRSEQSDDDLRPSPPAQTHPSAGS